MDLFRKGFSRARIAGRSEGGNAVTVEEFHEITAERGIAKWSAGFGASAALAELPLGARTSAVEDGGRRKLREELRPRRCIRNFKPHSPDL